jgi:hypothetical protein
MGPHNVPALLPYGLAVVSLDCSSCEPKNPLSDLSWFVPLVGADLEEAALAQDQIDYRHSIPDMHGDRRCSFVGGTQCQREFTQVRALGAFLDLDSSIRQTRDEFVNDLSRERHQVIGDVQGKCQWILISLPRNRTTAREFPITTRNTVLPLCAEPFQPYPTRNQSFELNQPVPRAKNLSARAPSGLDPGSR